MIRFKKTPKNRYLDQYDDDKVGAKKKKVSRISIVFRHRDDLSEKHRRLEELRRDEDKEEYRHSYFFENRIEDSWFLLGALPTKRMDAYSEDKTVFELDDSDAELIEKEVIAYAQERLLDYIAYRERALSECVEFLRNLPVNKAFAEELIKKAIERNYLNEKRFAELLVQSCISKKRSYIETKGALIRKRLAPELIEDVLNRCYNKEDAEDVLQYHIEKAERKYPDKGSYKDYQKSVAYLMRKGFRYDDFVGILKDYYNEKGLN